MAKRADESVPGVRRDVAGPGLDKKVMPNYDGKFLNLGDVLVPDDDVPESFFIPKEQLSRWKYLKGAKSEERTAKNGHQYRYQEGGDRLSRPDRPTIKDDLTGEGGPTASRFKHIIETGDGRYRRLTPIELERLNGFHDDWTNTGMPDAKRAFMMGNALVVGAVQRVE